MWRILVHSSKGCQKGCKPLGLKRLQVYLYLYLYIAATLASTNMEIVSISSIRHDVDWCLIPYDPPIYFPDSVWLGVWGVVWLHRMIRWLKDYGCDCKPKDKLMASWQPDQFVQPSGMMAISRWLGSSRGMRLRRVSFEMSRHHEYNANQLTPAVALFFSY